MNFFSKKVTFHGFIKEIKSSNQHPLAFVNIDESKYETLPYSQILNNVEDIASGVNQVKLISGLSIFNIFDNGLIKYYDSGEVSYIFYTTTKDHSKVNECFTTCFKELDGGIYAGDFFASFSEDKVVSLAKGFLANLKNGLAITWSVNNYSITLKYLTEPFRQFSLSVNKKPIRKIDHAIRRGTIKDLLNFNLDDILLKNELQKKVVEVDGEFRCTDYLFKLDKKEFRVFDLLEVRIFSALKQFDVEIQTNLTLMCSQIVGLDGVTKILDPLVKIYGADGNGSEHLEGYEVNMIANNEYWTGRDWVFNRQHRLRDSSNEDDEILYIVNINNLKPEEGLTLSIHSYNHLIEYLTGKPS